MPHSSPEQKLKSICTQERFIECYHGLSKESRGKVQIQLPPIKPMFVCCGFPAWLPEPVVSMCLVGVSIVIRC